MRTNTFIVDSDDNVNYEYDFPTATPFRIIRQLTGLTAKAFSKRAGISPTYWSELESGTKTNPSREIIGKISKSCGLSEGMVLYLTSENHPKSESIYRLVFSALNQYLNSLNLSDF